MTVVLKSMRDSVEVAYLNEIPDNGDPIPDAFGGYDDGHYADAAAIAAKFPGVPVLKFTVNPADNEGDCLDVESGDAKPADAPGWILRRRAAGHTWVTCYCSLATYSTLRAAIIAAKIVEPWYIIAAYPGNGAQVYALPNVVGHQFADRGPYDESVLLSTYPLFPQPKPAPPAAGTTTPIAGGNVRVNFTMDLDKNGNGAVIFDGNSGADFGVESVTPAVASEDVIAVGKWGSNPPVDGYWPGDVGWQDHGGFALVSFTGGTPNGQGNIWITVATPA